MTIPADALLERQADLKKAGCPIILESRKDAWYYGGVEIMVRVDGDALVFEVSDWDEGTGCQIKLTEDQVLTLIEAWTGRK